MVSKEEIEEFELNNDIKRYPEFDGAVIGFAERINLGPVLAYSVSKMVEIAIEDGCKDDEEALEHIHFNYIGAWYGEGTPIFVHDI